MIVLPESEYETSTDLSPYVLPDIPGKWIEIDSYAGTVESLNLTFEEIKIVLVSGKGRVTITSQI